MIEDNMLSIEEVKHVAMLARIGLKDEEVEKFRTDLSAVLDSFVELQKADVSGIDASGLVPGMENALREDVSRKSLQETRAKIMKNVPRTENGFVQVKSVF